jgi:hypothetical protein
MIMTVCNYDDDSFDYVDDSLDYDDSFDCGSGSFGCDDDSFDYDDDVDANIERMLAKEIEVIVSQYPCPISNSP